MANADYTFDNIISTRTGSFKKESDFSPSVRRMQTKLNRLGYNCGTADGYFGSNTETQVKAFQAANNLTVDGKGGASTLSKLDQLSPDTSVENYGRELTHAQLTSGFSEHPKTWKGLVFTPSQYTVMSGTSSSSTENSRKPNQYSNEWANCVTLALTLIGGYTPSSTLANQCYHLSSNSSYPSDSLASTRVQIPANTGNKFFDYQTNL